MKNGKKLLLLLLVLAVLVGATAIVGTISKNATDQEDETQTVFSLNPENVTNLGWDYSEKVSFTAGEDGWVCDQDAAFPVDETCLDKMLEALTDVESTKTIENPENLDQYGLEIPVCVITVEDGQSHTQDTCTVRLKLSTVQNTKFSNEMLVVVATSLPVTYEDLAAFHSGNFCYELHFEMENDSMYGFDSIDSYAAMNRLRKGILEKIRETVKEKNIMRIHMVLATSSDFTFFLAQGFSKNHDPEIVVYHYDRNTAVKYPWGISNISTPTNAVIRQVAPLSNN